MKWQFSLWHVFWVLTAVSFVVYFFVLQSNHRNEISGLQTQNRLLTTELAEAKTKQTLVERQLLIEMRDTLSKPPEPFSSHGIAKEIAQRIAIEYPNDQYIWWVLLETDALHDGLSKNDAYGMLGPSTDESIPGFLYWYDTNRTKPLKLRASIVEDELEGWEMAHGFRD